MPWFDTNGRVPEQYVSVVPTESWKRSGEPTLKQTARGLGVAFVKDTFAGGGEVPRVYVGRALDGGAPLCVKENRIRPSRRNLQKDAPSYRTLGALGHATIQENFALQRLQALDRVALTEQADAFNAPIHVFSNRRGSKLYIVERLMSGTLSELFATMRDAPGGTAEAAATGLGLCVAEDLGRIHGHRLLHLDIKPENVCYDRATRQVEVIDYGLAAHGPRALPTGVTLGFSSPEQLARRVVDARSDVYSLGATLGTLICGEPLMGQPLPSQQAGPYAAAETLLVDEDDVRNFLLHLPEAAAGAQGLCQAWFDALEASAPRLAPLVRRCLSDAPDARPGLAELTDSLGRLYSETDAATVRALRRAWDASPPHSSRIQNRLDLLDRLLADQRAGRLRKTDTT